MTNRNESTQSEIMVWHPYPEEKPKGNKVYYVSYRVVLEGKLSDFIQVESMYYVKSDNWTADNIMDGRCKVVIAWAEMPKGWTK